MVRLLVLRRCVLQSRLGAEECAARLRRSTHRLQPLLAVRRPFVGLVSADGFSVRRTTARALAARASGSFAVIATKGAEIRLELGVAIRELIPASVVTCLFVLGLVGTNATASGLVFAILAVAWLVMFTAPALRWNRRADELVARLSATFEAD